MRRAWLLGLLAAVGCTRERRGAPALVPAEGGAPGSVAVAAVAWPEQIENGCHPFAQAPGRTSLVYVTDQGIERRRGPELVRVALPAETCDPKAIDALAVLPDGRAVAFGTSSNMPGDLWGHSGRRVAAACVVDFEHARVTPIAGSLPALPPLADDHAGELHVAASPHGERIYAWRADRDALAAGEVATGHVVELPRPIDHGRCELADGGSELVVVCVPDDWSATDHAAVIVHYGLASWPPAERARAQVRLAAFQELQGTTLSADGRWLGYWGRRPSPPGAGQVDDFSHFDNTAGAVDVAAATDRTLLHERWAGFVSGLDFAPSGDVAVAEWVSDPAAHTDRGRLVRIGAGGHVTARVELRDHVMAVRWDADPAFVWTLDSCDAHRVRLTP